MIMNLTAGQGHVANNGEFCAVPLSDAHILE